MAVKRNPVKQIMSDVHRDVRAGKVDLAGHDGFIGEVRRRVLAAGLSAEDMPELKSKRRAEGRARESEH